MKTSSKIIVGLSVVAGLLAVNQASFAQSANPTTKNIAVKFMADKGQPASCPAPTAFEAVYTHSHATPDVKTLALASSATQYTSFTQEMSLNHAFVDSLIAKATPDYPIHILVLNAKHNDKQNIGKYWYYTSTSGATPCTGNVVLKLVKSASPKGL